MLAAQQRRWMELKKVDFSTAMPYYNCHDFYKKTADEIWLLTIYSKSEKATIPSHILKNIAEEIENE